MDKENVIIEYVVQTKCLGGLWGDDFASRSLDLFNKWYDVSKENLDEHQCIKRIITTTVAETML